MVLPAETLNLCGVLSESKHIINAHSRHFLALSVLFLLPLSFSLIIYPTLNSTIFPSDGGHTQILLRHYPPDHHSLKSLTFPLLYALFIYLFSLCALATITYSTYNGFYGRPVKLLSAVKSLLYSFLPLVSTTIVAQVLLILISLAFLLFVCAITKFVENILGFEIDYNSNYFFGFCVAVSIVLGVVLICFQVNWALALVIVVVESKWGFEPLRRSAYLVRGMKWVSLSLLLFLGILTGTGFWVWENSNIVTDFSLSGWKSWAFILQTVVASSILTLFLLHNTAANTVFYMYCKALHGELAFEIAEEFAREYISLPFDDEKLPHVVTIT